MKSFPLLLAALLLLAGGCASYKVIPITEKNRATAEGVRYCRPAPYLLVLPAGTPAPPTAADSAADSPFAALLGMGAGLAAKAPAAAAPRYQIIYLPDPEQTFAIQRRSGIGTAEVSATLVNGWLLTGYGSKTDTKVPETLGAMAAVVGAFAGNPVALHADGLAPGLYKIDLAGGTLTLTQAVQK